MCHWVKLRAGNIPRDLTTPSSGTSEAVSQNLGLHETQLVNLSA